MPAKSRYSRTIEASKQIARAAGIAVAIADRPNDEKAIGLQSILGLLRSASVGIETVVEQCQMARGMYINNSTARNTIIRAGEYLHLREPKIAEVIMAAEGAKERLEDFDFSHFQSILTNLAVDIASVQFDPSLQTSA